MALLVFTLVFIALGLGVLFIALSGGPSGARRRMGSQTKRTRRIALFNFILATLILGLAIPATPIPGPATPAAGIATVENRNDVPQANVSNLNPAEEHGRELFGQRCRN